MRPIVEYFSPLTKRKASEAVSPSACESVTKLNKTDNSAEDSTYLSADPTPVAGTETVINS